ncbi:MAG: adenylosuccinate lyase, partial [Pseudomonadota bacterium]
PKILREKGRFDIARIHEIEAEVKHDVIAFLDNVAENAGPHARFMHQGMTSSDVLDTCYNVQLNQAASLLLEGIDRTLAALRKRIEEHRTTITIGRSHGIHAEPTTFGVKLAGHFAEFARNRRRLLEATKEISTCSISGAVGSFANVDPLVEAYVADKLGLVPEPHSTQIIPRDRHAVFFTCLAVTASAIERMATEVRHLQRSELREVEEYFSKNQKGSSAMPHKRNPVLSENLCGLARLVRMSVVPALENVTLWHERDISNSSVERVIGPDTTVTLDFALHRCASMIENLVIYPENMQANLHQLRGLHNSQRVMLALVETGMIREEAYRSVQACAMQAWHENRA